MEKDVKNNGTNSVDKTKSVVGAKRGTGFFIKKVIKLKNHLYLIPLTVTVISMVIITFTMFIFSDAIVTMPYNDINAFCYFVIVLSSVMGTVSYLMANARHVSKFKKIAMHVIFYVLMVLQIGLDIRYILDVDAQVLRDSTLTAKWQVGMSQTWSIIHIVVVCIAIVLSIAAPLLQPSIKKIQLGLSK